MIRRDNSQDAERPRNYSSFWIDVAQGKDGESSAGAALSDDILDLDVPEDTGDDLAALADLADLTELATPAAPAAPPAKPAKNKPADKKPEAPRSLSSLADLANIDMLMKNSADLGDEAEVDLASDEAQDLDPTQWRKVAGRVCGRLVSAGKPEITRRREGGFGS